MKYVRFWRGTFEQFKRLTNKNEDTLYFVMSSDYQNFALYLGYNELISGDELNQSSIDALQDVIISKNLHDR